jgi:hypothetical protein
MHQAKLGVLAAAIVGLVGCFLPLIALGDASASWFALRAGPGAAVHVYLVIAAFAVALGMAALGGARGLERWQALIAAIAFLFVVLKFRAGVMGAGSPLDLVRGLVGGKLIAAGALGGLALALVAAWRPQPDR